MRLLHIVFILLVGTAPTFTLPTPTGTNKIGTAKFQVQGESFLLWYPASGGKQFAPYAEPELLDSLVKNGYYGQSKETIESWKSVATHSYKDAQPAGRNHPLVILLPGAGVSGFQYTALAEEFASHGYVVAVEDYYSPLAPERKYAADDSDTPTNDMARNVVAALNLLSKDAQWKTRIDFTKVAAAGHSIGGAAAIAAARMDRRIKASIDMDGGAFGDARNGAVVPLLVLRSKPIYSDEDLAKRGRTREQFEKAGQEARRTWLELQEKSGSTRVSIYSVQGTGHFSFSDSPFTMPDAITRFGGKIIDPARGEKIITTCILEFLGETVGSDAKPGGSCSKFDEIGPGIPPALPAAR